MKKDIKLIEHNSDLDRYHFSWSGDDGVVSGKERLLQEISKRILTARGSNKFESSYGEKFVSILGNVSTEQEQYIKEIIPVMIKNIQEDIINRQSLDPALEKGERLKSIDIIKAELDDDFLGWTLIIQVVTQDLSKNKFTVI